MGNNESAVSPLPPPTHPLQQHQVVETTMSENGNIPEEPDSKENTENAAISELIIDSGGVSGFVEVSPTDTLLNVRSLIIEEFDEDMIPDEGDFYFCVNGIRLSAKQEARKLAVDFIHSDGSHPTVISIHSKRKKQKISQEIEEHQDALTEEEPSALTVAANDKTMGTGAADEETDSSTAVDVEESESNKDQSNENAEMEETVESASNNDSVETVGSKDSHANGDADTQPPTEESSNTATTDGTEIESARRLLNFNGTFPYDRHNREGDEESVSTEDFTGTAITSTESNEAPAALGLSKEPEDEPMAEVNAGPLKDASGTEKENVVETESTSDVVMMNNQDDDDEEEVVEEGDIVQVEQTEDPHKIHDQALKSSCTVLTDIKNLLNDNPLFCSEDRRKDWTAEISESLAKSAPNVVIGVLGNTGVGKSSLLNAILEEASVLPTSGSRGCTAAVVELRFNKELKDPTKNVPVYKGEVEFITLQEWATELKILIDECSTAEEKTIYARRPEEERQPDAAAAWAKIDQVYGRGTMERFSGRSVAQVYDRLINDQRVKNLLRTPEGSTKPYNAVLVQEGEVSPEQGDMLLKGFSKIGTRLRRTKKKWAQKFRGKINDYVYRKGNGHLPQTWPLIRKVVLEGPWVALMSGACLVDLPGVRDANAARAKVAESYLMNCNQIWIVAPIKRAVDDGTAKELLGEQFKRRLLMDGQYGNVAFVCTQTDDCEATEIMRDHQDVAMLKPGRWEKMSELRDKIMTIEKDFADLVQEEEDLKIDCEEAEMSAKDAKEELVEEQKESDDDDDAEVNVEILEQLQKDANEKEEAATKALVLLKAWQAEHQEAMQRMQDNTRKLQRRLKSICATVRNEYSTSCLQEDFRAGLKELCRKPDEEEAEGIQDNATTNTPLPENFNMDVYCISANDYLKIEGIKPSSDGPPNTFSKASDTQIPNLRAFVHTVTASFRENFTKSFVDTTSDMVDRVKLLAADASNIPGGRTSRRCQSIFESEMERVEAKIKPIADDFRRKSETRINSSLSPSLQTGAAKAQSSAMSTVTSWGSKSRRTKNERNPNKNGLYYSTYLAVARRDGAYVSKSAGQVDFNQEMCDPMEKEFGSDWQRVLDSSIKVFLRESEAKVLALASSVDKSVVSCLAQTGLDSARLSTMAGTASRSCTNALKASFRAMNEVATNTQRELNRSLLPKVQARMKQGYTNTTSVPGGCGKFMRMKNALEGHANVAVHGMFDESTTELLNAVHDMVKQLSSMIAATSETISKTMEGVYSVCWDDQSDKAALLDPAMQQKVRECRDKLLPDLNKLRKVHDETMELVGIEREELDLDVMEVATWEKQNAAKLQSAIDNNMLIDLCDSDDEAIAATVARMPPAPSSTIRIKADPGADPNTSTVTPSLSSAKPPATRFV